MTGYQRCVFRNSERVRIVNLSTFEGTDANSENWIYAYGFNAKGEPIFREKALNKASYKISGSFIGSVSWTPMLSKGFLLHDLLGLSTSSTEKLVGAYLNSGIKSIGFAKKHELAGMAEPYIMSDNWVVMLDKLPQVDYTEWNKLLRKLGSEWRIFTVKIGQLLTKLEFNRVMSVEE